MIDIDHELLSREEEQELIEKAQDGDKQAEKKLVRHNLKLVFNIADKVKSQHFTLEDKFQYGVFGLYKAIDKFDISKGYKFSTYALWWIRQQIQHAIKDYSRTIRVSRSIWESGEEKKKEKIFGKTKTRSLNEKIQESESDEIELMHVLGETDDRYKQKEIQQQIEWLMSTLSEKEKKIVVDYYMLGYTEGEIAEEFDVTRSRINQIKLRAKNKIQGKARKAGFKFQEII